MTEPRIYYSTTNKYTIYLNQKRPLGLQFIQPDTHHGITCEVSKANLFTSYSSVTI